MKPHSPNKRTPLTSKRTNPFCHPVLISTTTRHADSSIAKKKDGTTSRVLWVDENEHGDRSERQARVNRPSFLLAHFAALHLRTETASLHAAPPKIHRLRRPIMTTRYLVPGVELRAELILRVARKAAITAANRNTSGPPNHTLRPPALPARASIASLILPPPTPTPQAGSSPFVRAQRRIHHMRYASVEVKSRARALREGLLRARGGDI